MDENANRVPVPWHLWLVGAFALLFTAFGGYDYYMSQIGDRAYIEAAVAPFGIDTDAAVEYFSTFPFWLDLVWAIGVWGGVLGSILLLLRKRIAYPCYAVSLAALVVSNVYGFVNPMPGMTDPGATLIAVAVVFTVMLALTFYARAMGRKGALR